MTRIETGTKSMRPDAFPGSNGGANGSYSLERGNPYAQSHTARIVERLRDPRISPDRRQKLVQGLSNLRKM